MWHCEGTTANLRSDSLAATIDLARPPRGLSALQYLGSPLPLIRLLGIVWPSSSGSPEEPLEDHYIRGCDLVATYAATESHPVRPQIYWRVVEDDLAASRFQMELIVSMQTNLLDSEPRVDLVTELADHDWQVDITGGDPSRVVCRHRDAVTLVLMAHPSDRAATSLEPASDNSAARVVFQLFAEHLEKGVIRRGRVRVWLAAREPSEQEFDAAFDAFCNSPPPLTT